MWRAYGGTTGVALVMNNAAFQATAPSDVLKIYASPVAYFNPTKFIEKFDEVVTNIENEADFIKQQDREDIKGRLFRIIGPTRDPLAMREAFADLLAKAGVEQPIFISHIPLRQ